MSKKELLELRFPAGGLNRRRALREPPPFTTSDCCNVRPDCAIKGRERGGSRPGLARAFETYLAGAPQFLSQLPIVQDSGFGFWQDPFDGDEFSTNWWRKYKGRDFPAVGDEPFGSVEYQESGDAVRKPLTFLTTKPYSVEIRVVPRNGSYNGEYRLYARMDDDTLDADTDGVTVSLVSTDNEDGYTSYTATLTSNLAGVPTTFTAGPTAFGAARPVWLRVLIDGDNVKVFWGGDEVFDEDVDAHTGTRFGFGVTCMVEGELCLIDTFRAQYYEDAGDERPRNILVGGVNGLLFRERMLGELAFYPGEEMMPAKCVRDIEPISVASRFGLLYVADYGLGAKGDGGTIAQRENGGDGAWYLADAALDITPEEDAEQTYVCVVSNAEGAAVDGTYHFENWADGELEFTDYPGGAGACSFRVERGPKIYNPNVDSVVLWLATAEKGQVPVGCPLICRYRDRMVLAGNPNYAWYMSRQGDPHDWDYGADPEDTGRAVAGVTAEAGQLADALTAIVPHGDDYLLFCCRDSLWVLRGDPALGGQIDNLSRTIGVLGPRAWCKTPEGVFVFLSRDGLYAVQPGVGADLASLSRERIPEELLNVDAATFVISLEYDVRDRGIHIYLTPTQGGQVWTMK